MRAHARLNVNKLRSAAAGHLQPSRLADGGNLWLSIGPTGAASWLFRYQINGKPKHIGLGPLRDVPAIVAREQAGALRAILASGRDPRAERDRMEADRRERERKSRTFKEAVETFLANRTPTKNAVHNKQWESTLRTYALPVLGDSLVSEITRADVLEVVEPIWKTKSETARRVRARIEAVFDAAMARGWRDAENPARLGPLKAVLGKLQKPVIHHASMPWADVPAFAQSLGKDSAVSARALEFVIATAARTNEVIGATWAEIDLKAKVWTVPGERMKGGRPHRVPLTAPALRVLDDMKTLRDGDASPVFPGSSSTGGLSNMAMPMLLRRADLEGVTVHGFRSSFRVWARESARADHDVAELCLAHVTGNAVVQAYQRSDLLDERRKLMTKWAAFVWPRG
jgi:integrase